MKNEMLPSGSFRAAVLVKNHQPLEIAKVEFPRSLRSKQVLVKNHFSSICGSQLGEIDGKKGIDPYLPHLLGHEAVGTVIAIANDVNNVKVGETVVLHWMKGRGGQSSSHGVSSNIGDLNAGPVTTFSEFSVISENRCTPIDTKLPLENLSLFGCSITTAFGSLKNDAAIEENDALLVLGLGALGMWTLEMSKLFNVSKVMGIDVLQNRVSRVLELGFESTQWNFEGDEPRKIESFVKENMESRIVVIDTTGKIGVINRSFQWLKRRGVMVLVGVTPDGEKITIDPMPLHFGVKLVGSFGGSTSPEVDIPRLVELAEQEKYRINIMENSFFELTEINDAIHLLRSGSINKMNIRF